MQNQVEPQAPAAGPDGPSTTGARPTHRKKLFGALLFIGMLLFVGFRPEFVPLIMASLWVHEKGHELVAIKTGAKSKGMYFHPFGMVVFLDGFKSRTTPLIALAGPWFGMLPSFAFLMAYHETGRQTDWLMALAIFAGGINLFNLLPLHPLDGGRVMHGVIAAFSPRLAVAYVGLVVLAGFWFAYHGAFLFLIVSFMAWMELKRLMDELKDPEALAAQGPPLGRWRALGWLTLHAATAAAIFLYLQYCSAILPFDRVATLLMRPA